MREQANLEHAYKGEGKKHANFLFTNLKKLNNIYLKKIFKFYLLLYRPVLGSPCSLVIFF